MTRARSTNAAELPRVMLDAVDETARVIGAVNTVTRVNGRLVGSKDAGGGDEHGERRRALTFGDTGQDYGGGSGLSLTGDVLDGAVVVGGEHFRELPDEVAHHEYKRVKAQWISGEKVVQVADCKRSRCPTEDPHSRSRPQREHERQA